MPSNNKDRSDQVEGQERPVVQIVGKIAGTPADSDGGSAKYLLHCGWTRKTYQVSTRGLKMLRSLDITVVDEPANYTI